MNKIQKIVGLLLSVLCLSNASAQLQKVDKIEKINDLGYPLNFSFRGEYNDRKLTSASDWIDSQTNYDGVIKKFVRYDELAGVKLKTQEWVDQYAEKFPEKLILLHWDAREHRNDQKNSSEYFFPGHWLSFPGTRITKGIDKKATEIQVESTSPFGGKYAYKEKEWRGKLKYEPGSFLYPILLLVELDDEGNRIWDHYEFVKILEIDEASKSLKVERKKCLSQSHSFSHGAYIAPMSTRLGKEGLFDLNCSSLCPKDKNGKTALDILQEELLRIFRENPNFKRFDGIAFDVLQWEPRHKKVDANGDGEPDGGWIKGVNTWRQGTYSFMKSIRKELGEDFILTADGYGLPNQRGIDIFNGIESEGLVEHNDAYRGIAKTMNLFTYWKKNTPQGAAISYLVDKKRNPKDQENDENLRRLYMGMACCLGVGTTVVQEIDELTGGSLNQAHWLGLATGNYIDLSEQAENKWKGFDLKQISSKNCEVFLEGKELLVKSKVKTERQYAEITIHHLPKSKEAKDVCIHFELKNEKSLQGMDLAVPRFVQAKMLGLPKYETKKQDDKMHNHQLALAGREWHHQLFYYRNTADRDLQLQLKFEGKGEFRIRNAKVQHAPLLIAREFEKGIVLVNNSFQPQKINLDSLFPQQKFRKLNGITHPDYNNGKKVSGLLQIEALNAIFLLKK